MIKRNLQEKIEYWLWKSKILIIYWPRRVWKTTIAKTLLEKYWDPKDYFDCDEIQTRLAFQTQDKEKLKNFIGNSKFIVIDEAQRVQNIWLNLKILIDNFPDTQIIATWSSSFDLANKINEPLTWRHIDFFLSWFWINELTQKFNKFQIQNKIWDLLRFWMYPDIILSDDYYEKEVILRNIASNYLYKDILEHENIKKSDLIIKLLQALALQVWNQVSDNELANLLNVSRDTINRYINLLEKSFVIYRLWSFSRNIRNELKFSKKIYFYDNGIKNALINNFNTIEIRQDTWSLWENFLISERQKYISNNMLYRNTYFWRNHAQAEIDYIEEYEWKLHTYDFKWWNKKAKIPKAFIDAYPESSFDVINKDNFLEIPTKNLEKL